MVDEVSRLGLGGAGHVEVLVDLQAANLLAGRQQVELVTRHAPSTERGNDLAGRDRLAGEAAVTLVGRRRGRGGTRLSE